MRKKYSLLLLFPLIFTAFSCGPAPLPDPDIPPEGKVYIDMLHINDLHGKMVRDDVDKDPGIAKIGRYIKNRRARNPDGLVLLSGGDMWQGSSASNSDKGLLMTEWMNMMGFDAMTLGNHEFDWGQDNIRNVLKTADFPFLGANIVSYPNSEALDYVEPYTIVERLGIKIGIIGIIGNQQWTSIYSPYVEDITFDRPLNYVREASTILKEEENCDIVVLSMHEGASSNNLSTYSPYVDVIFAAHNHEVYSDSRNDVYIIEGGVDGHHISQIRFIVDVETKEFSIDSDLTGYTEEDFLYNFDEDPEIAQWLNENHDIAGDKKVIGRITNGDLDMDYVLSRYSAESILEYVNANTEYEVVYALDSYSQRATLPEGDVTYERLYKAMPFDNEIVILNLNGFQLEDFSREGELYPDLKTPVDAEANYLIAATNFTAFKMSTGRNYTAIIDFDPDTQVVEYLDEVYAREIVRMDMETLLAHGESVDASAYR